MRIGRTGQSVWPQATEDAIANTNGSSDLVISTLILQPA